MWGCVESTAGSRRLCYVGANLVPVEAHPGGARALRRPGPPPGPALLVDRRPGRRGRSALWELLEPAWGPARGGARPTSRCWPRTAPPLVPADPLVRRVRPDEIDVADAGLRRDVHRGGRRLAGRPATAARPTAPGSPSWSRRAAPSPGSRTAEVLFKAEVGAVTPRSCQVQGVWVDPAPARPGPRRRRHGRGGRGTALARSRPSSRCTSTTTTPRRWRRTSRSASPCGYVRHRPVLTPSRRPTCEG